MGSSLDGRDNGVFISRPAIVIMCVFTSHTAQISAYVGVEPNGGIKKKSPGKMQPRVHQQRKDRKRW